MTTSAAIRDDLTRLLRLDLVGPGPDDATADESLPDPPSRWYLTGFLVPTGAPEHVRADDDSEELDSGGDKGVEDGAAPETGSKRKAFFPSSIGVSILVPRNAERLDVTVQWGEYDGPPDMMVEGDTEPEDVAADQKALPAPRRRQWQRRQHEQRLSVQLPRRDGRVNLPLPGTGGLHVFCIERPVPNRQRNTHPLPDGTRSVSVFLVNQRPAGPTRDLNTIFQATLQVRSADGFVARPDMRGADGQDPDERIGALQYRDVAEYAVGHNVATRVTVQDGRCQEITTEWVPTYDVARVAATHVAGLTVGMDDLAAATTPADLQQMLAGLPTAYRAWLGVQRQTPLDTAHLRETSNFLLNRAEMACGRIEAGIAELADPAVFLAFTTANRAMAMAARRRRPDDAPKWRTFQLAFVLLNICGVSDGHHEDREKVDLLFFPTGGGKTEAYLGLAAFTLILRRLRNDGDGGAGVSVIMRYTLRLLTLDQLSRAATMICALEQIRPEMQELGAWPFEIGLWVGLAATPNRLGKKGDQDEHNARAKVLAFQANDKANPPPIPLEECPWCGTRFRSTSFRLVPNADLPDDLRVVCSDPTCAFTRNRPLPIVAVDEPIYRRLPGFLIATVDKFAAMPWTGQTGALFGKVDRFVPNRGFYGPCDPPGGQALAAGSLPPPDLIIQDELHLISGPLGTTAGLYEVAIEALASRGHGKERIRPKIIASTATIRRASEQIKALFGRGDAQIFPPMGPDRRDSFFARTESLSESPGRRYVGISAPGRSAKVVLLRAYVTLLSAAQAKWQDNGGKRRAQNPADPYMTLLGYFSSLRELGGSRRIVEDEVRARLHAYAKRARGGALEKEFTDRQIDADVMELTSRVSTAKVAMARARLGQSFADEAPVHVALATNMISVGLDIPRLGLMVVLGQPKTTAEYIQATSRVGREVDKPGLVVTLFNAHRPRDRSHYERFEAYHQSFYRAVEVTSVTPFSPRAIDRVLPAVTVALARLGHKPMTAPLNARDMDGQRTHMQFVVDALVERAESHGGLDAHEAALLKLKLAGQVTGLLDDWANIAADRKATSSLMEYAKEVGQGARLIHEPLSPDLRDLTPKERRFVAARSMRNVEPAVDVWVERLDGGEVAEAEDA